MTWLNKKTGPPAKSLVSVDAARDFVEQRDVAVIGFFPNAESTEALAFVDAAATTDDIEFGIASDADTLAAYEIKEQGIVLFKKVNPSRCYD